MHASITPPRTAARESIRRAFQNCLFGLGTVAAFASSTAHAQYADWTANPPKILPNERVGSGASDAGSGRQFRNLYAFAALNAGGSITAWGRTGTGGSGAPTDTGYTAIYSSEIAFAALKENGSITAWGEAGNGGSGAPTGSGYTSIYSNGYAFAAMTANGSIKAWGNFSYGGSIGVPTDSGYVDICSNKFAFAARKADGTITAWGYDLYGGTGAPTDSGYTAISSSSAAFAALKADGSITAWGLISSGGAGAPTDSGYTAIYSNPACFAALKADGSITAWGSSPYGGTGAPSGAGFTEVYSTYGAFAALKANGSITAWGGSAYGGSGAPTGTGFIAVCSTSTAFAALKADGSITAWGSSYAGGSGAPTGTGYIAIYSNAGAFAARKSNGSVTVWGGASYGGSGGPTDSGYTAIYSSANAFAALKADGSITAWGNSIYGGSGAPTDTGLRTIQSVWYYPPGAAVSAALGAITSTTAEISAEVIRQGSNPVTARGFVYAPATVTDPKIGDPGVTQVADSGSGLGSYSSTLSGLTPNTAYVLKSYVIDSDRTTYSVAANFSTNLAPLIASFSGASNASVSVAENSSNVTTVSATDADAGQVITYSITGGADAARFVIGSSSGALTFVAAPDFEAPADANADNVYQVIVTATDNGNTPKSATQTLNITVTNLADNGALVLERADGTEVASGGFADFGSLSLGQTADLTFTLRSVGEADLALPNGPFIGGALSSAYTVVGSIPSTLATGSSITFTLHFIPIVSGSHIADLSFATNDTRAGRSSYVLNLRGTGLTSATVATYANAANQVRGGWINSGNFTIGAVGTTNPGNNWPSAEGPDKVVDSNTGSKFLIFRNSNAGLIFSPTNANVVFNRLSLSTANDSSERDPASYVIYGSTTALSGAAGTNISLEGLTELASGSITLPDNRSTGPTVVQFANTTAYASYIVAFPTVRSTSGNNITQISEVQLSQGINPPCAVAMAGARGGQLSSGTFTFGSIGSSNPGNNWNANESPDQAIDGSVDTKYLLFRNTGAGLIASPQAGPARVNRLNFWTANDSAERDPLTYQVYGFTTAVTARSGTLNVATSGTLLGSGTLTLPATRNAGPQTVTFDNSTAYASYLVVFPTVKNSPSTTMMQISEVQFGYNGVPTFQAPTRTVKVSGPARATAQIWQCITSSADGTKLAAAGEDSQLYTSSDSGVTWTAQANAGTRKWRSIALSADGTKMVAGAYPSQLYTSTDSGVTWTARETSRYWRSVASSSDGTKLAAVVMGGQIYTSTDSGVTWTARASARNWNSIASSVDGTKLVAAVSGGQIYTSTDSGVTWTARESTRTWYSLASSADGTKLVAAVDDGQLYTSGDSGATWTARETTRSWKSVACSADGTKMVAVAYGTQVYVSTDSGSTWAALDSVRNWFAIASSSDGGKLVGAVLNGQIYTLQDVTLPDSVTVAEDSGSFNQAGVVTGITPGIGDVGQTVSLSCTNDNRALFSVQPAISADGTLTFTPAANANGSATVTVIATDSTGLSSASQNFTINVTSVVDAPFLATTATSASIATTTATLGGEVTASEATVTERGVVYAIASANAAPQIGGTGVTRLVKSGTTGVFTANATSLAANTTYSFRAYATNSAGTSYSDVATFTTLALPSLSPSTQTLSGTYGTTIASTTAFTPTGMSGTVTYSVSPSLPAGLSLNSATGVISGTPAAVKTTSTTYTITGAGASSGSATATVALTVAKAPLTVVAADQSRAYGVANPNFSATFSGLVNGDSSGVISGAVDLVTAATSSSAPGTYTITASIGTLSATNYSFSNYTAGTLTIRKAVQSITLAPLASSVPLKNLSSVNLSATSSAGLPVTLSLGAGSAASLSGTVGSYSLTDIGTTGIVTVLANQAGNDNYAAATQVVATFDVTKANQVITFEALTNKTYGDSAITLAATSDSAQTVSYTIASGPATLNGSTLTLTGAGTVVVRASQAGNDSYNAATAVERSFTVAQKTLTVTGAVAANKVADESDVATISGAQLVGVINGDEVTLANESAGTFSQSTVGTNLAVTTTMTLAGAKANNYTLTQPTLTANITVPSITHTHQELWRFANYGTYLSEGDAADEADPDQDGLNNLLEYALGLDTAASNVTPASLALSGGNLEYTYTRSSGAQVNGMAYQILWTDSLEIDSWSTQNVTEEILADDGTLQTVKVTLPASQSGKRFLRLQVVK